MIRYFLRLILNRFQSYGKQFPTLLKSIFTEVNLVKLINVLFQIKCLDISIYHKNESN